MTEYNLIEHSEEAGQIGPFRRKTLDFDMREKIMKRVCRSSRQSALRLDTNEQRERALGIIADRGSMSPKRTGS